MKVFLAFLCVFGSERMDFTTLFIIGCKDGIGICLLSSLKEDILTFVRIV